MNKNTTENISMDEYDEYPELTEADFERAVLRKNFEPIEKLHLPEEFANIEEGVEYWETHSLKNYLEGTEKIDIDALKSQRKEVSLARNLIDKITLRAKKEGVSIETLVNLWVSEKLQVETS